MFNLKTKLLVVMFFSMLMGNEVSAELFGSSNYEECMSDGKVGRNKKEISLLEDKCLKKFPKLPKLYSLKNSKLICLNDSDLDKFEIEISNEKFIASKNKSYPITFRSNERIVIKNTKSLISVNNKVEKKLATATINNINGHLLINIEDLNSTFQYDCTEK